MIRSLAHALRRHGVSFVSFGFLALMVLAVASAMGQEGTAPEAAEAAAAAAPAGGGLALYVNPFWLALFLVSVCLWLYLTSWISADATGIGLNFPLEAGLSLAVGWVCVLLSLLVHAALSFLTILATLGYFAFYIVRRNEKVPEQFKFLGPQHRARLFGGIPLLNKLATIGPRRPRRVSLPLRNESGRGLDDLTAEQPALADAADVLVELIVRGAATATRRVRLQPAGEQYIAQYVLDGVVHNVEALDGPLAQQLISCVSRFVGLSRDGRLRRGSGVMLADVPGMGEVRISARIAASGGKPVLQLDLPNWASGLEKGDLAGLGMHEALIKRVKTALHQKRGAIIVCGPAGSGKTVTLYGLVNQMDVFATEIFALERREEYELEHIRRWTFDEQRPFRAVYDEILREGPQAIMFGELQTDEQARCLLEFAADEGLLLTTLKGNDAPDALVRVSKLAGDADLVNRAVTCVVAQQLVRKLCTHCREEVEPNPQLLKKLGIDPANPGVWYRPVGCEACLNSGYRGRTGVFGMLILTDPIKEALKKPDVTAQIIRRAAGKSAFRTMYQDGLAKVTAGITTLDELRRVLSRR